MPIQVPPSLSQVGAPAHSAHNAKLYLTRDGSFTEAGYWTDMTFTPEVEVAMYRPAGAGTEYPIKGLSRVNGTLNRGHINTNMLKHMQDAMKSNCDPLISFTIEAEFCYPDGSQKKSTVVIYGVHIPQLTVTVPVADLTTESITFTGQYFDVFDGSISL